MNQEELLNIYLDRLRELALERLNEKNTTAIAALREAFNMVEGEMKGY